MRKIFLLIGINLLLIHVQLQAQSADELREEVERKLTLQIQEPSQESLIDQWRRQSANPQARGVILGFHKWPTKRQERIIINYLKKSGLKKVKTVNRFKIWIFDWVNTSSREVSNQKTSEYLLKPKEEALNVCKNFPKMPVLEYCEANALAYPASTDQNNIAKQTEADATCIDCFELPNGHEISTLSDVVNEGQESCQFIPSNQKLMNSTLSDYWAQELIGSDLLREELQKVPAPEKDNYIAVFDSRNGNDPEEDLDSHAVKVRNLISDDGIHAVLPNLENKVSIFDTFFVSEHVITADSLLKENNVPSFVNSSLYWAKEVSIHDAFQSLSPPAVVVVASGNKFHEPLGEMQVQASKNFDAILVGSFSLNGFKSDFSSSGEEVHILAPSSNNGFLSSATADGNYAEFGGTSGATPLVTGGLGGFEWLSGYHPTAKEAKLLLEKTAVPTLHSHEEPQTNGSGLLNAYKLGMVGKRLREKCHNKESACFQKEINNEVNYEFTIDDKQLKESIASVFPGCNDEDTSNRDVAKSSCEDKKSVFKELRQSVLLVSDRRDLWEALSCVYKTEGFSQNAETLSRIALAIDNTEAILHELQIIVVNEEETVKNKASAMLLMRSIAKENSLEVFQQFSKHSDLSIRGALAIAAGGMDADGLRFLNKLSKDEEEYVRSMVAIGAERSRTKDGVKILQQLSNDSEEDVRKNVALSAIMLGNQDGLEIIRKLSNDPEKTLKMYIITIAEELKGEFGLAILRELLGDPERDIKERVAVAARKRGGDGGLELLRELSKDDDVKGIATVHAVMMEKEDRNLKRKDIILEILRELSKDDEEHVRSIIAITVGHLEKNVAVEFLVDLLQDSEVVRKQALKSIEQLGMENELEFLLVASNYPNADIKRKTAILAGNMGGEQGGQVLQVLSKDRNKFVREEVLNAAIKIGGREEVQILEILSQDTHSELRYRARRALHKLHSMK